MGELPAGEREGPIDARAVAADGGAFVPFGFGLTRPLLFGAGDGDGEVDGGRSEDDMLLF
jgi:hypothetical protein